jgi:hypothetical protein
VKKNYTIAEREALAMVYVLHKYWSYLLGNKFVFYVDHMVLLYFVKRPQLSRWIVRWLLLFLKYDILVGYKPGHSHSVVDAFLQFHDVIKNLGIPN